MKLIPAVALLVLFWLQQPDNTAMTRPQQPDGGLVARQQQPDVSPASPIIRRPARAILESALSKVDPVYPPLAKAARVHGPVLVEVEIDENGRVTDAHAISGHPLLRAAAETAGLNWTFKPATLNDGPARVTGLIIFKFQASDSEIDHLRTRIMDAPSDYRSHDELAAAYVSQGRYDDAVRTYDQAIMLFPTASELHCNLGDAFFEMGKYREAADEYRVSAELWPLLSVASWGLARAEAEMGHNELAIRAYKDAIHANDDPEVMYELGELYNKIDRHQEALEILERAAGYTDTWEDLHFELGVTYVKTGRIDDAKQEYQKLMRQDSQLATQLLKSIRGRGK